MSNHRFSLERNKKQACPNCQQKTFVLYLDSETGKHLSETSGRCDRESSCGFHYPPRQFFADNPNIKAEMLGDYTPAGKRPKRKVYAPTVAPVKTFDCLSPTIFKQTIKNYRENGFANYLHSLIESDEVDAVLKKYCVGSWTRGETVFWQIDRNFNLRTGQIIDYNPRTGKRIKSGFAANWVHASLKRAGELSEDFELNQCLFGSHLLPLEPGAPVAIVESAKTAIVASIFVPDYVWLACVGKSYLKLDRLRKLAGRKIVLFPDADGFRLWNEKAIEATRAGLDVTCSDLIETFATLQEKANGFDVADYLLSAKISERENSNSIIDEILSNPDLLDAFNERISIAEFGGNLSPEAVERPDFVRTVAAYVYAENQTRDLSYA